MNRIITAVNCLGVIALAILCFIQWGNGSRLEQRIFQLSKTSLAQESKLGDQDKMITQKESELADLRQQLSAVQSSLKDAQASVAAESAKVNALTASRDQLKTTLDKWIAAVNERDAVITQAGQRLQSLAVDRDGAVQKFNDLAAKYNAVVKDGAHASP